MNKVRDICSKVIQSAEKVLWWEYLVVVSNLYLIQQSDILKSLLERTVTVSKGNGMCKNMEGVRTVMD